MSACSWWRSSGEHLGPWRNSLLVPPIETQRERNRAQRIREGVVLSQSDRIATQDYPSPDGLRDSCCASPALRLRRQHGGAFPSRRKNYPGRSGDGRGIVPRNPWPCSGPHGREWAVAVENRRAEESPSGRQPKNLRPWIAPHNGVAPSCFVSSNVTQ